MQKLNSTTNKMKSDEIPFKKIGFWLLHGFLLFLLLASSIYLIDCSIIRGGRNGVVTIGNTEYITVLGDYMEGDKTSYDIPTIESGSLVTVKKTPESDKKLEEFYSSLQVGDVVKARDLLYRISEIEEKSGIYIYELKCDNSIKTLVCTSEEGIIEGKAKAVHKNLGNVSEFIRTAKWLIYVCVLYDLFIIIYSICIILFSYRKLELEDVYKQLENKEKELYKLNVELRKLSLKSNYSSAAQYSDCENRDVKIKNKNLDVDSDHRR